MRLLLLAFLSLMASTAIAESSMSYGYLGAAQWVAISDPDGTTEDKAMLVPLGGFVSYAVGRDLRYRVDLSYLSGNLSAGVGRVGQDFKSMIMAASLQWRLRLGRTLKPWVGAGVTMSQSDFTTRYTVDAGGFLANQYPDRSQTGYAATVMASNYWELNRSVQLGIEAVVDIPVATDLRRVGIGVSFVY